MAGRHAAADHTRFLPEYGCSGLAKVSAAGIQIAHDDVEHLTRQPGFALGHRRVHPQFPTAIGQIAVAPRNGRQASATEEAFSDPLARAPRVPLTQRRYRAVR